MYALHNLELASILKIPFARQVCQMDIKLTKFHASIVEAENRTCDTNLNTLKDNRDMRCKEVEEGILKRLLGQSEEAGG